MNKENRERETRSEKLNTGTLSGERIIKPWVTTWPLGLGPLCISLCYDCWCRVQTCSTISSSVTVGQGGSQEDFIKSRSNERENWVKASGDKAFIFKGNRKIDLQFFMFINGTSGCGPECLH